MKRILQKVCILFLIFFFIIIYVCNFVSEGTRGKFASTTGIAAGLINLLAVFYFIFANGKYIKKDTRTLCIISYFFMFMGYALIIFFDIRPSNLTVYGHAVYSMLFDIASLAAPLCTIMMYLDKTNKED